MMASQYTSGLTSADQTASQNITAAAVANKPALSTQQPAAMTSTAQPGIIASKMNSDPFGGLSTVDYNGQKVVNDPWFMNELNESVGLYNKATGMNLTAQQYDERINPTTAGARWGAAGTGAGAVAAPGGATPATPTNASNYTAAATPAPAAWSVSENQTVAGNLKSLIDPNNPLYKQWATAGAQDAAARGFTGNSTIRDSGIINSVMQNATPIAQSDASTYAKAAGYNTDQINQVSATNTAAQNAAAAANAGANNSLNLANVSSNTQKYIADQSAATQKAVASMSNSSQAAISAAHDANSVLLANNSSAQAAYSAYVNAIANIDIQPSMDAAAKQAAIVTQTQLFNSQIDGLKAAQPNLAGTGSPLDIAIKEAGGVDVTNILNGG